MHTSMHAHTHACTHAARHRKPFEEKSLAREQREIQSHRNVELWCGFSLVLSLSPFSSDLSTFTYFTSVHRFVVSGRTTRNVSDSISIRECVCVCVYLLRNAFPNAFSFLKGFLGSTTKALPGTTPSVSPCITAMKESVVGSGPIRIPGKSCSNR